MPALASLWGPALWARLHQLVAESPVVVSGEIGVAAAASARAGAAGSWQAGPVQASGVAQAMAEAEALAVARGAVVKTSRSVMAAGQVIAEAVARTEATAEGHLGIGQNLMQVDANLAARSVAGAEAKLNGMAYLGIDRFGLPGLELGGSAQGSAGVRAEGTAGANLSLLGLISLHIGTIAQAIAGAAAGALFHLKARNGDFALQLGATGAAGVGGQVATEVGVQLGPLPEGLIMTVVSPIIEVPELAIASIGKLLGLVKKGKHVPGLGDYPKVAGKTLSTGAKMIVQGAKGVANDLVWTGKAIGHGVAAGAVFVGKTVAGAAVGLAKGIGGFFGRLF